jgi:hypothetical protein
MILEDKAILVKQALRRFLDHCMDLPAKRLISPPKRTTNSGELLHEVHNSPTIYIGGKNYRVHVYMYYWVEEIKEPLDVEL